MSPCTGVVRLHREKKQRTQDSPMQHSHPPAHDEIAQRARSIWDMRGQPSGHDLSIWLEAERQLSLDLAGPHSGDLAEPVLSPGPMGGVLSSPKAEHTSGQAGSSSGHSAVTTAPDPDVIAAKVALNKKSARAPILPTHKNAPPMAPAESGKPLWNQPHSS